MKKLIAIIDPRNKTPEEIYKEYEKALVRKDKKSLKNVKKVHK